MTSLLKEAGSVSRSVLKVSLPCEEQLAHFLLIERMRISFGSTPILLAQEETSALNTSEGTVSSRGWKVSS